MDFNEYQQATKRTQMKYSKPEHKIINGVLGLTGEAGEVSDLLKKAMFQGHILYNEKIIEELGDVLWYISLICDSIDTTIEHVALINIQKLKKRYPNGFEKEKSINREE